MTQLTLDVERGAGAGFPLVADALAGLRARTLELWRSLPPETWARPSRCEGWTVHDVVRHVRDGCKIHVARLRHEPPVFPTEAGFDNQRSPDVWLEASAGESPDETLADLAALMVEEATALAVRDPASDETDIGPYGPVHWTGFSTHMFWDAWIHDRDVTAPLAIEHRATAAEDSVAAAYGVFVATIPARMSETPLAALVALQRSGAAPVLLAAGPGAVAVLDATDREPDVHGDLLPVLDALAGRGAEIPDVLTGDPSIIEPLTWLRAFMTSA